MDNIKNDRYYLEKIKTLVCTGDLMNGVLWYTYHRSDMTEHLGDSVSRQDAKNCGGSVLSTHRIPNHHIWRPRKTTAFRKTAFRILSLFTMIRNTNGTSQSTGSLLRLSSASRTAFQSNAVVLTAEGLISRNQVTTETEPGDTVALTAAKRSPTDQDNIWRP